MERNDSMSDSPSQVVVSNFHCGFCQNIPSEGQRYDPMTHCRQCWLYHTDSYFNRLWGGDGNVGKTMATATCCYLGKPNGEFVECPTCGDSKKTRLKLFECKIHGSCLPSAIAPSVQSCINCTDRQTKPSEYWTGYHDPIPGLPVDPQPFGWANDSGVVQRHREGLNSVLGALKSMPELPESLKCEGRGILFCGGGKYWPGIVVACTLIRRMGCNLPIQIWYRGREEKVDNEDIKNLEGISLVDATQVSPQPRIMGGWEIKTFALLHCPWEEVLYLDADAYPVSNLDTLFDFLGDRNTRIGFWSDFPHHKDTVKWDYYIKRPKDVEGWDVECDIPPIQGGQLYINRRLFYRELLLAHWINQHSEYFYHHQYGDQDSWRVALALTGGTYTHLGPADLHRIKGGKPEGESVMICGIKKGGASEREPVIVHRCQAKLFHPWHTKEGKSPLRDDTIPREGEVFEIFDNLRIGSKTVFKEVYESGHWGPGGISGSGSQAEMAKPYLELINGYIHLLTPFLGDSKVVDLGCGDGRITTRIKAKKVVGVDVYSPHLSRLFVECPRVQWICQDISDINKLPEGDILLVKDVFHHWTNEMVVDWIYDVLHTPKWKHVFITVDVDNVKENEDCPLGGYRPLNETHSAFVGFSIVRVASYLHKGIFHLCLR